MNAISTITRERFTAFLQREAEEAPHWAETECKPSNRQHFRLQNAINNVSPAKPMWAIELGTTKILSDCYYKSSEARWAKRRYQVRSAALPAMYV